MVEEGSVTISFTDGEKFTLRKGDMLVIPGSKRHGAEIGPQGGTIIDLFSPSTAGSYRQPRKPISRKRGLRVKSRRLTPGDAKEADPYRRLHGFLRGSGIKVTLEELKNIPWICWPGTRTNVNASPWGNCVRSWALDKTQAKALLREWKHGDDHSESSYRKMMETDDHAPFRTQTHDSEIRIASQTEGQVWTNRRSPKSKRRSRAILN